MMKALQIVLLGADVTLHRSTYSLQSSDEMDKGREIGMRPLESLVNHSFTVLGL